jgi:hypothetical protein
MLLCRNTEVDFFGGIKRAEKNSSFHHTLFLRVHTLNICPKLDTGISEDIPSCCAPLLHRDIEADLTTKKTFFE